MKQGINITVVFLLCIAAAFLGAGASRFCFFSSRGQGETTSRSEFTGNIDSQSNTAANNVEVARAYVSFPFVAVSHETSDYLADSCYLCPENVSMRILRELEKGDRNQLSSSDLLSAMHQRLRDNLEPKAQSLRSAYAVLGRFNNDISRHYYWPIQNSCTAEYKDGTYFISLLCTATGSTKREGVGPPVYYFVPLNARKLESQAHSVCVRLRAIPDTAFHVTQSRYDTFSEFGPTIIVKP